MCPFYIIQSGMRIRDLVYNYIEIPDDQERRIIDTRVFQRLRYINQHALAYYVYPSLRGVDRFGHSLGTAHLAELFIRNALKNTEENTRKQFLGQFAKDVQELWKREAIDSEAKKILQKLGSERLLVMSVRVAGLLHDLGHLPFSHQSERAVTPYLEEILGAAHRKFQASGLRYHEFCGLELISEMSTRSIGSWLKPLIRCILHPALEELSALPTLATLHVLFEGDLDVDRAEYTLRDGAFIGRDFGGYDLERIVKNLCIYRKDQNQYLLVAMDKAVGAIERFMYERYFLYKWVYYHPAVKLFDAALERAIKIIISDQKELRLPGEVLESFPLCFGIRNLRSLTDSSLVEKLRMIYKSIPEATTLGSTLERLRSLLSIVLFREKLGFSLFKNNVQFYNFSEEVAENFLANLGEEGLEIDEKYRKIFVNSLTSLQTGTIQDIERTLQEEMLSKGMLGQILITALPETHIYSGKPFPILTKVGGEDRLVDLIEISPFCASLERCLLWDPKLYVHVVYPERSPLRLVSEDERTSYWSKVTKALGRILARLCKEEPDILARLQRYVTTFEVADQRLTYPVAIEAQIFSSSREHFLG